MSQSPVQDQNIAQLLHETAEYTSPTVVAQSCRLRNWEEEYRRSIEDPDRFWGDYASRFEWSRQWDRVSEWDGINHKWFIGGRTNITINALDRHADSDRRNRVAYIFLKE